MKTREQMAEMYNQQAYERRVLGNYSLSLRSERIEAYLAGFDAGYQRAVEEIEALASRYGSPDPDLGEGVRSWLESRAKGEK